MKAVVFDWETTGLTLHPLAKMDKQPRAIEFGGVLIDGDGNSIRELSYIIDPEREIDADITRITGLTNDDLRGKPKFAAIYPAIRDLFGEADIQIAHNLPFDDTILELELERLGVVDFPWPRHSLCTVQIHQEQWGKRPKLTQLYEETFGEKLAQTHRALDDCLALAKIVVARGLLGLFSEAA